MLRLATALIFSACLALAQPAPTALSASPLDLAGYLAELDRWAAAVTRVKQDPSEATALRGQLPPAWSVSVEGQRYEVPTEWLRDELESIEKNPESAASCAEALERLHAMRAEALRMALAPSPPSADARQKLNEILKRREFRGVRGPSWLDQWRDRLALWLAELLSKLLGRMGLHAATSRILVWVLIALSSLVLLVWMVRRLMGRHAPVTLTLKVGEQAAKTWQDRAREAFAAAERGDFREAIRLAYWAGVFRLEELGLWKTARTRTHREYLRLLPTSHPQRDTFSDLTRRFELAWYAGREASADDFRSLVKNLERLGCVFPSRVATERS
jgi:hypothetical protein